MNPNLKQFFLFFMVGGNWFGGWRGGGARVCELFLKRIHFFGVGWRVGGLGDWSK